VEAEEEEAEEEDEADAEDEEWMHQSIHHFPQLFGSKLAIYRRWERFRVQRWLQLYSFFLER
jgi:hypothetical protein